jgi:putative FmdB family regulatory protein
MPFYDYHCDQCEKAFEVRQSFQEKEQGLRPDCPNCLSSDTRQLISAGMVLRSTGSFGGQGSPPACGPNAGRGCCG